MYTKTAMFIRGYYRAIVHQATACNLTISEKEVESLCHLEHSSLITLVCETLPKEAKCFIRSLETGFYEPPSFFKDTANAAYFCCNDELRARYIAFYRQLTEWAYKVDLPCSDESITKVFDQFILTDESLPDGFQETSVLRLARRILREVLPRSLPTLVGRHGSGAVADRVKPHRRWREPLRVSEELHYLMGFDETWGLDHVVSCDEYVSKTACVPKDSRGPRLICMEEFSLMFHQQPIAVWFKSHFRSHPLLRGSIDISDQTRNRDLAQLSSTREGPQLATLDLSEASDRVSNSLVASLFPPEWTALLCACRSKSTKVLHPSGNVLLNLKKFAPMGSALCFPVETLVFFAIVTAAVTRSLRVDSWTKAAALVSVYGDDIIVPSAAFSDVIEALEAHALKVNQDKSFVRGFFRESCGMDAYLGYDVTPIRLRKHFDGSVATWIESTVELSNNLYKAGWWVLSRYVRSWLRGEGQSFEYEHPSLRGPGLAFESWQGGTFQLYWKGVPRYRFNSALHCIEKPVRSIEAVTVCKNHLQEAELRQWHHEADRSTPCLHGLRDGCYPTYAPVGSFSKALRTEDVRIVRSWNVTPAGALLCAALSRGKLASITAHRAGDVKHPRQPVVN